jgi:hypothetical protein
MGQWAPFNAHDQLFDIQQVYLPVNSDVRAYLDFTTTTGTPYGQCQTTFLASFAHFLCIWRRVLGFRRSGSSVA